MEKRVLKNQIKEFNRTLVLNLLLHPEQIGVTTPVLFKERFWNFTLRKSETKYEPYKYELDGIDERESIAGTYARWGRRYQSLEDALLHIVNSLNENANIKDRYSSIEQYILENAS